MGCPAVFGCFAEADRCSEGGCDQGGTVWRNRRFAVDKSRVWSTLRIAQIVFGEGYFFVVSFAPGAAFILSAIVESECFHFGGEEIITIFDIFPAEQCAGFEIVEDLHI